MSSEKQSDAVTFELRPARPDDETFLCELYCSTRHEEMASWGLDDSQQAFLKLQFTARQRHYETAFPDADHKIVLFDDRAIGRTLVFRSAREIRLVDIALLPEHRGCGIGGVLVRALCDEAQAAGKPVTLHVAKTSRAARLYERLGFSIVGETGGDYKMEWRSEDDRSRRLRL